MKDRLKKLIASLTSVCVLVAPTMSYADGINNLLNKIVSSSFYQGPGLIKSPTTNTLTFGSYSFRLKNNLLNTPVLSFNPPQASISCAGADFNAGWLSVLNFQSFQDLLENAGSSLAWGIVLGLVYSLPGVASVFSKLNEWGRMFQSLASNSCMTGVLLGKSIGASIWGNGKMKAQADAQGSGAVSSFENTITRFANEIKEYGQLKKFFGDIPYGPLFQAGLENQSINDLIASLFGVVDWRAVGPDGHACSSSDCLKAPNIKVMYYHPLISDLSTLLNGGNLRLYHCNWQLNPNVNTFMCIGGVYKDKEPLPHGGLTKKVEEKINKIVDNIINGGFQPSGSEAYWIESVPLPGFTDILNYLAVLKKRGYTSEYKSALYGISELVAIEMLKSLVNSAYSALTSAEVYLANKDATTDLNKEEKNIDKARGTLDKYINDDMKADYINIEIADRTFQSLKASAEHSFYKKFGKSTQLFMSP